MRTLAAITFALVLTGCVTSHPVPYVAATAPTVDWHELQGKKIKAPKRELPKHPPVEAVPCAGSTYCGPEFHHP